MKFPSLKMVLAVVLVCTGFQVFSQDGDEFELVKTSGGLALYQRWVEVEPGLKIRELKAEFTLNAGTQSCIALLKDSGRAPRWMQSLDEFQLLECQGDSYWTSYVRYSIPWPLEDQDVVLRYHLTPQNDAVLISFQSCTHSAYPPKGGVTRMKGVTGSWHFKTKSNGQTFVTYKILTRNKSSVPRWVTDPVVQGNLIDTMNAFCVQVKELHAQR